MNYWLSIYKDSAYHICRSILETGFDKKIIS